jgi:uncharacterized membrane protein
MLIADCGISKTCSGFRNPQSHFRIFMSSADQFIPRRASMRGVPVRSWLVWIIVAGFTLAFVSLVVIAPMARARGFNFSALLIYEAFGKVCNQLPVRSFYLEGHAMAVCARCAGIYFGFAGGVLLYPLVRSLNNVDAPARKWLLLGLAPTALDFALDLLGFWKNTHLTRSATGALAGAVVAFYVVPGLIDLSRMIFRRSSRSGLKV